MKYLLLMLIVFALLLGAIGWLVARQPQISSTDHQTYQLANQLYQKIHPKPLASRSMGY